MIRASVLLFVLTAAPLAWGADMALLNQLSSQQMQSSTQTQNAIAAVQPTLTQGLGGADSAGAYNPTYASPGAVNPAQTSCQSMGDYWNSSNQTCSMNAASACAKLGGSYSGNKCQMPSIGSGNGGNPSAGYSIAGDGTMTEWGRVTVNRRNYVTVYFPKAFPHALGAVTSTILAPAWKYNDQIVSQNNSSVTFYVHDTTIQYINWQATGW